MRRGRYVILTACLMCAANLPGRLASPGPFEIAEVEQVEEAWMGMCQKILQDSTLYAEGWDTLPQTKFWRLAMQLDPQTSLINIAKSREILGTISTRDWDKKKERHKKAYKDSIRKELHLDKKAEIYITSGKNHFYKFHKVIPSISKAIDVFMEEDVDPWYAQSILLIESPGKLQLSTAGAYGPFQLMAGVAKEQGLTVNKFQDDRKDFEKSAKGAARLIRRTCLPKTRSMLEDLNISYKEDDIWFRLLVLHVYHAGARNVKGVLRKIKPKEGGIELLTQIWQTEYRRFGNASQNYSQIALASLFELHELALEDPASICPISD